SARIETVTGPTAGGPEARSGDAKLCPGAASDGAGCSGSVGPGAGRQQAAARGIGDRVQSRRADAARLTLRVKRSAGRRFTTAVTRWSAAAGWQATVAGRIASRAVTTGQATAWSIANARPAGQSIDSPELAASWGAGCAKGARYAGRADGYAVRSRFARSDRADDGRPASPSAACRRPAPAERRRPGERRQRTGQCTVRTARWKPTARLEVQG